MSKGLATIARHPLRAGVILALTLLAVMVLGVFTARDVAAHAITGAIWTSLDDGTQVNGNIYDAKDLVYLNGGPIHEGAAGLPPSDTGTPDFSTYYVFQVTDPSGSDLLSTDKAKCRVFTVGGDGRIDGVVDSTTFGNGGDCSHDTGTDTGITIKLVPYANTPNLGGEYKVWITRLGDFADACGTDITSALNLNPNNGNGLSSCGGKFGFAGGHTKTDNYKVKAAAPLGSIAGIKYYDVDESGTFTAGDLTLAGWPIKICRLTSGNGNGGDILVGQCDETFTSATGAYGFVNLGKGEYRLREARARDVDTDPGDPDFNGFDWKQMEPLDPATTTVYATNAIDIVGVFDEDLMNGVHVVTITNTNGDDITDVNFGNKAFERLQCDGLTPGYWKNWRNHYTDTQMLILLAGTIAPTIALADDIYEHWDFSPGDELTMIEAFLLSNQLTLNLTAHPGLPNPDDAGLLPLCTIEGVGSLEDAIADALAILADPSSFDREAKQAVKNRLAAFAELDDIDGVFVLVNLPDPPLPVCFVGFPCPIIP